MFNRFTARLCLWLCSALLPLSGGCFTPGIPDSLPMPERGPDTLQARGFRIGPNDILRVGVHGHPELSTPSSDRFDGTRVDPDGTLSLPLIGSVTVEGVSLNEARERVTAAYATYIKEPRIHLSVIEYASRRFYLHGEVNDSGPIAMDRPLNVYQAISFGGGFTNAAARSKVLLLRETPAEVEVHVINCEGVDTSGFMDIRPDDFIFVMRSGTGRFQHEGLPILMGFSSAMAAVATALLIENRVD